MSFPASATLVTVTETYASGDGTAETGTVEFTPSTRVYWDTDGAVTTLDTVTAQVVNGVLKNAAGNAALQLPATDDADSKPTGWTWRVTEKVGSKPVKTRYIHLPSDPATVALHTLADVEPAAPGFTRVLSVNGQYPDAAGNVTVAGGGGGGGEVPAARRINTGTGLSGGGDLSIDRTHAVLYGTTSTTACRGDDTRLSDARTPLAHTHAESEITNLATDLAAKATKPVFRKTVKTDANVQLNTGTNTWGPLTGSPTVACPAVAGDLITVDVTALRQANSNIFLDWGVLVGGGVARYASTDTATPAGEGNSGLYHTALPSTGGTWKFVAGAGDVSGGNVTVGFAIRNISGASSLLLASTDNPLALAVTNLGPSG